MTVFRELDSIPSTGIWPGVLARMVQSEHTTMALVELEPDGRVPEYRHENEQLGFVLEAR